MNCRPYNALLDYWTAVSWWVDWGWKAIPSDALPRHGIVVIDKNEAPIAMGWLYLTDSRWSLVEFVISNKQYDKILRQEAVDLVISKLTELSDSFGCKYNHAMSTHPRLIESYKKSGWKATDSNVTTMVRSR